MCVSLVLSIIQKYTRVLENRSLEEKEINPQSNQKRKNSSPKINVYLVNRESAIKAFFKNEIKIIPTQRFLLCLNKKSK